MAKARGTKANRTRKGGVSAAARRKYGSSKASPNRTGSFPVFDQKSAMSALKLRGHARSRSAVVSKVAGYANRTGNATVKAAVARARKADKKR
jgi:hypothetical protein